MKGELKQAAAIVLWLFCAAVLTGLIAWALQGVKP